MRWKANVDAWNRTETHKNFILKKLKENTTWKM